MEEKKNPSVAVSGLAQPETPVLSPDGRWFIVEMHGDYSCVSGLDLESGEVHRLKRTGRPNGVAVDHLGQFWVADTNPPALVVLDKSMESQSVITELGSVKLLFPNDLCFGPDGFLYLTDSGILLDDWAPGGVLREDWPEARCDGRVWRINPETFEADCLDEGLQFVNGLCFDPNGGHLYVNEMLTGEVYRYKSGPGGAFGSREQVVNVTIPDPEGGFRGPDGMAFSADGLLWVAVFGQKDITVVDPQLGVVSRRPTLGAFPTNCAFGPAGDHSLYVTEAELGQLELHPVGVDGAPLYFGSAG